MPPRFGVSSAEAGEVTARAISPAATDRSADLINSSRSTSRWFHCELLVQPEPCQILVDEMRRRDLEAFDIGAVRHDAVPPQCPHHVRLLVEHVFLEAVH